VEGASDGSEDNTEERRYVGPGTFEVPDEMVESYLDRGWERPDAGESEAPEPATQEPEESEPDADEAEAEGFDAAGFVDDSWQSVVARIEDGEADGHLEDVREAEQDRDSPRSSVIEALEERV
jgi:hypothetical protein